MPWAEVPALSANRQEILSEKQQYLQGPGKKSESSDETRVSEGSWSATIIIPGREL